MYASSIKELVKVEKNGLLFSSPSELADEFMVSFLCCQKKKKNLQDHPVKSNKLLDIVRYPQNLNIQYRRV